MIIATIAQLASEHVVHLARATTRTFEAVAPTPNPDGDPGPAIHTNDVVEFLATKIAPILLAVLGVIFISRAGKGEMSRVLTSSAIAVIGLAFIAGAGALFLFGKSLITLIFG